MRPGFLLLLATTLSLGGCFPEPYPHSNPDDPDYSATPGGDDVDGDGFGAAEDCDDGDASIYPGAVDIPYDGIDQDCSQGDLVDVDEDGYVASEAGGGDCDDTAPGVNPGAAEVCDGIDNDCDEGVDLNATDADTFYPDEDSDSYGDSEGAPFDACEPPDGYADNSDDCDDGNADVAPGVTEVCDEIDNNCNGRIDENVGTVYYLDADADGYGDDGETIEACEPPDDLYVLEGGDCNDSAAIVYPGAEEVCEETGRTPLDNDCDGDIDEGVGETFYIDGDEDGFGDSANTVVACELPAGATEVVGDCDDEDASVNPDGVEVCDEGDALDNDCDGETDEGVGELYYVDGDDDGFGGEGEGVLSCVPIDGSSIEDGDCNDDAQGIYPGAPESCGDGIDSDCDGEEDPGDVDGDGTSDCSDDDGDGYCEAGGCSDGSLPGDCNDIDPLISPSAVETLTTEGDPVDEDCDGLIDEGFDFDADFDSYSPADGDCDDTNPDVNPGAIESLNGIDDNCDGEIDRDIPPSDGAQYTFEGALDLGSALMGVELNHSGSGILAFYSASDPDGEEGIALLLNSSFGEEGALTPIALFEAPGGSGLEALGAVGDINGDGNQDLAFAMPSRSTVCVFLTPESEYAGRYDILTAADFCVTDDALDLGAAGRVALLDMGADGRDDLILGLPTYSQVDEDETRDDDDEADPSKTDKAEDATGLVAIFKGRDVDLSEVDAGPLVFDLSDADYLIVGSEGEALGESITALKGGESIPDRLVIGGIAERKATQVLWVLRGGESFPGAELEQSSSSLTYSMGSESTQIVMSDFHLEVIGAQGDIDFDDAEELGIMGKSTEDSDGDISFIGYLSSDSLMLSTPGDVSLSEGNVDLYIPTDEEGSFGGDMLTFSQGNGRVFITSKDVPLEGDDAGAGRIYAYETETLTGDDVTSTGGEDALYSLIGPEASAGFGSGMVIIDIDKDGIDEVFAGAPGSTEGAGSIIECPLDSGVFDR